MPKHVPSNNEEPTVMDQDYDWSQVSDQYAKNIIDMVTEYYHIPDHFQERIYWGFYSVAKEVASSVNHAQTVRAIQESRAHVSTVFHAILERAGQSAEEEE